MALERIVRITGTALPVRGDNIDTDRIIPARFLRSVSFEGLEDHLFADDRTQNEAQLGAIHPIADARFTGASILLVNANFGCGSSREHAPQAIQRRGFHAVVGESFSEIFFGNSVALGMPCVSVSAAGLSALMRAVEHSPGTILVVDLEHLRVTAGDSVYEIAFPATAREAFLSGTWDATGLLLEAEEEVAAVAGRLPYIGWTRGL